MLQVFEALFHCLAGGEEPPCLENVWNLLPHPDSAEPEATAPEPYVIRQASKDVLSLKN